MRRPIWKGSSQCEADPEPGNGSGNPGHGTLVPKQRERLLQSHSLLILTLPLVLYPSVTPQLNHPPRAFAMGCSPHIGLGTEAPFLSCRRQGWPPVCRWSLGILED